MLKTPASLVLLALAGTLPQLAAQHDHSHDHGHSHGAAGAEHATADSWERFNDWNVGDVLFFNLNLHGVGGFSSGDPDELTTGGHDPNREPFSAQALESAVSLRTEHVEGFANYLFFQEDNGAWDSEFEELFGKLVNLPGDVELKGGQYFAPFGVLNRLHLHDWNFVDSELVLDRFLGEHGLLLQGGEVSWTLPLGMAPVFSSVASLGFGDAPDVHHHLHGHENGEDTPHHGEDSHLVDDVCAAHLMGLYRFNDFHRITAGTTWAGGGNDFGRDSHVFGIDAEYLWREHGLESGGRAFLWRNELLWREVQAFSQHDDDADGQIDETFRGTYEECGCYSHFIYTWNQHLDTGLRLGWVEGVADFGEDERRQVAPVVTWWLDDDRRLGLRTQYIFDSIRGHDDEHSLWFQLNLSLGGHAEVH